MAAEKRGAKGMNYKIGDLGRVYGLSNETIRYYEKRGILHSVRDSNSNYRTYDVKDVYRLGIIKNVRNMGFSLNDSIAFHKGRCEDDIIQMCTKRRQELQKEIRLRTMILEHLDVNLSKVWEWHRGGTQFRIGRTPRFYRFEAGEGLAPIMGRDISAKALTWMQNLFLVEPCSMLYRQEDGGWRLTKGLITTEKAFVELELEHSGQVTVLPSFEAVSCLVHTKGGDNQWDGGLRERAEAFMEEQGLSYAGAPFYVSILYYYDDEDVFNNYLEYYIPVKIKT